MPIAAMGRWIGVTTIVGVALACAPSAGRSEGASGNGTEQRESAGPSIRHLVPATDSIGDLPARFEWTPVPGADRYAISVYNDVDRLLWRREDIDASSVARPDELDLDAGTYFWRVSAIRDNRQLADSGWSAFIVRR
jgi:hypothetical protein